MHGVMKRRARQYQSIDERHGNARLDAACERPQHAARPGTMHADALANADINGGNNKRLPVHDKADMTDHAGVQNFVNRGPVVDAALRQAMYGGPWRLIAFRRVHQAFFSRYGLPLGRGAKFTSKTQLATSGCTR